MDPYQVLGLEPTASMDEVQRTYFCAAKIYHPNKGGSEEEFLKFQRAYQQILQAHNRGEKVPVAPKDFHQLKGIQDKQLQVEHQYRPQDFQGQGQSGQQFNRDMFNQSFQQHRGEDEYTYDIDKLDMTAADRKADDYRREYARVTAEAEGMTPFGNGRFNHQIFNHAFVHMKEKHKQETGEVEEIGEPAPATSNEVADCINLDNPRAPGSGNYTDFQQAYRQTHSNPGEYDGEFLAQFQGQPDITREAALSTSEIKKRMGDWHSTKLKYNKDKLITDKTAPLMEVEGLEAPPPPPQQLPHPGQHRPLQPLQPLQPLNPSFDARDMAMEQARQTMSQRDVQGGLQGDFNRMMMLRAPQAVAQRPGEVTMSHRPVSSSTKGMNRELHGQIVKPAALLVGKPPPIHRKKRSSSATAAIRKHKHKSKSEHGSSRSRRERAERAEPESIEDRLRRMQRTIRKQQKAIERLTRDRSA